jgi:hypothetical protein
MGAIISVIASVAAALFAIKKVLNVIEFRNEETNLETEFDRLNKLHDELNSELEKLKSQLGL